MKRLLIYFLIAATGAFAAQAASPSAQDILAASDRTRNPDQSFRLTDTLTEYVGGRARDRMVLTIYAKENRKTGEYANLVRYVDPPRDRGKMVLMNGSTMWFYDSASKASVRISPQQRLMGQAANGDVVTTNFSRDYKAVIAGEETVKDPEKLVRNCWKLNLTAADAAAVYSRIEYWVEKGTFRPVKGKFYSDSGRLLKIAYYHKFQEMLGGLRPSETVIIDAVNTNLVTTMSYGNMTATEIPDAWFQREYLPRLKAE
jgi:hypothetical protein